MSRRSRLASRSPVRAASASAKAVPDDARRCPAPRFTALFMKTKAKLADLYERANGCKWGSNKYGEADAERREGPLARREGRLWLGAQGESARSGRCQERAMIPSLTNVLRPGDNTWFVH